MDELFRDELFPTMVGGRSPFQLFQAGETDPKRSLDTAQKASKWKSSTIAQLYATKLL